MSALLDHLLERFEHLLSGVEELCVNGPDSIYIYTKGKFSRVEVPGIDYELIEELAWSAAAQRRMDINEQNPILDTDLRGGRGRLSACVYPVTEEGKASLTIRRGEDFWPTYEELAANGLFDAVAHTEERQTEVNPRLIELYRKKQWAEFFPLAVAEKQNILGCGLTASGKTTLMRSAIRAIPDPDTRVVTIQDTAELSQLDRYLPNSVQMFYDSNGTGVPVARLVATAMRMRPEKLILQEIRDGAAAVAYTQVVQTGHPGFTTIHAGSCLGAFDRLRYVIKQTSWGAAIQDEDLMAQLQGLVDVVVHSTRDGADFAVDEVWFRHAQ